MRIDMKYITFTPKGLISLLISFSLLCNMAAPALAQSRVPSATQIEKNILENLPPAVQDTVLPGIDQKATFKHLAEFVAKERKGKLTDSQVQRIQDIEQIFLPDDPSAPTQTDFDYFQEHYTHQVDEEFQRESNALADSRNEVQRKIDASEKEYRAEIYTAILPKTAERVLNEQAASQQTTRELLAQIKGTSFDPQQDLSSQLNQLAGQYAPGSEQATLLTHIAQAAQQDANLRNTAIKEWKEQAETNLNDWYTTNTRQLKRWHKEAKEKTKDFFEKEYQPILLKEREQVVVDSIQTLWDYKDLGSLASDTLLEIAPIIAPMSTLDGKSFFSPKQKDWLVSHYLDILRNNHTCGDKFPKDMPCEPALRAMGGLSLLTDSRDVANAIEEFMTARRDSAQSVPVLLLGTAALLAMKQYTVLRGFLYRATQDENSMDNVDLFSVETLVNTQANRNGHYLGEVSKYGQYPLHENHKKDPAAKKDKDKNIDTKYALGNAWEDVAQILADEGSAEALALLREFGVERCTVLTQTNLSFKEEKLLSCAGIIPFLAGALLSGKSGAEQYNPAGLNTLPGYAITPHGNEYISAQQANQNRHFAQQRVQTFRNFAAERGLTEAGAIIYYLFNQSMGDLNAESELRLDTRLYEAFQALNQTPKAGFTLTPYTRNSPEYNAKRLRQDRVQVFRTAGRIADLAILVWCLVDLTKWAVSGVKIAGAFSHMARMARGGATVAQRAAYLHRLKIAPKAIKITKLPARVKSSASAVVLAQLPQFTNQTVKLPALPGALKSVGVLTAENLALSAETGNLLVNYQGLRSAGLTAQQAFDIKTTVEGAVHSANTTFANSRRFTLNPNRSYTRSLHNTLGSGLKELHFSAAEQATVLDQVASLPVNVPGNIQAFKTPDLFGTVTGKNFQGFAPSINRITLTGLMARSFHQAPTTAQVEQTANLLETALHNTNIQFAHNHWWKRSNKQYKKLFMSNLTAAFDKDGQVFRQASYRNFYETLMAAVQEDASLTAPTKLSFWRSLASSNHDAQFITLGKALFVPGGANAISTAQELPLTIQASPELKPVKRNLYQRVTFTPLQSQGSEPFVELGLDGKRLPLVKIQLNAQEVPALFTAAAQANMPLKLKVTATQPTTLSSFWNNLKLTYKQDKKRYFFRGRGELFPHEIPVSIRQADGSLQSTKIVLNADSHLGWRNTTAVLDGKNLSLYKDGKLLQASNMAFSLPKNQLAPFLNLLRTTPTEKPFALTLTRGKNKIKPLMWANGLSLSAASSGLIVPLENTYGDQITETDKILISLALPYIPALLSPVISPFAMRYGALNVLKASMVFSLAGLGFAGVAGFRGYASQQSPLPPLWPLFVSGTAIGISSSLSRASLNLLIDGMGGGGQLLKSMLAKNVGSVALLLPPFVANFIDKDIDFSLAFPTMSVLSLAMLGWVSVTRINPEIGREAGFKLFKNKGLLKEGGSALRLLATREVLPLVLATTAFTGFEAASFYKAGNQLLSPSMKNTGFVHAMPESNRKNATALLTALAIQSVPLLARATAKPLTNALVNPLVKGDEYRRMLKMSYALNIAGSSLLFANGLQGDNAAWGALGLVMMGLGTANVTQSLQKLSNLRVLNSRYVLRKTAGLGALEQAVKKQSMVTKTMTGFSSSQIGLALVPLFVSRYTDRQIAEGVEIKSQAARDSMWIPLISIGLSAALAGPAIGLLPKHIPTGLVFLTKGIAGSYPAAAKQLVSPQFYLKKPIYGVPPGFLPIPTQPIINMGKLIPGKRVMETSESKLRQEANTRPATPAEESPAP